MARVIRRTTVSLLILSAVIALTGCSFGSASQKREIDAAAERLALSSISPIVCDFYFGPPPIDFGGVRVSRNIMLSGPEHAGEVIAELEDHGFVRDESNLGPIFTGLDGPNGVLARIEIIEPSDKRIGTTFDDQKDNPCVIPTEGITILGLSAP